METNEHSRNGRGHRIYSVTFKQQLLAEVTAGDAIASVARKHGIPIQNLNRWKRLSESAGNQALQCNDEMVPVSELKKAQEEIKQLRQALGKMTLDRDILKDAVEIASKKKWI